MRLGRIGLALVGLAVVAWISSFAVDTTDSAGLKTACEYVMLLAIPAAVIVSMAGIAFEKDRRLATVGAAAALGLWLVRLFLFFWPALKDKFG